MDDMTAAKSEADRPLVASCSRTQQQHLTTSPTKEMAARSQITVLLLLFLLSTEHSFAGTQNKLTPLVKELLSKNEFTPLVKELLSKYRVGGMFSMAVSIPLNQNQDQNQNQVAYQIIQKVIHSDPAKRVKETINNGESVSLSPTGSDEGNGSDLRTAEDVSSAHIGCDSGEGNGKVSRGNGKVSKGKGGKGRRGKEGKGKVRKGKGVSSPGPQQTTETDRGLDGKEKAQEGVDEKFLELAGWLSGTCF
ncbi:unnamed protein product [Pleuronectes platessa]|uniref:Uncharacterized protein n=1 Tax=Pleuronectes platessa TaxID=8262 RepID=A0A9N7U3V2_PLEPL|nr:unnamed protein product [Pleuronectes platessa]